MSRCVAFAEKQIAILGSRRACRIVYVPCGLPSRQQGNRFCDQHARAYRELVLGIIVEGKRDMPVGEYYKGSGEKVMKSMKSRYGEKAGERVFYATANAKGMNRPGKKHGKKKGRKRGRK